MGKSKHKAPTGKKRTAVRRPAYGEVLYDEQGYRIGDDGYPMTRARTHLHRLLDVALVFGYLCIAAAVVLVVWALFQGQSYDADTFIAYGGNQYAGHDVAPLMRGEALVAFLIGMISVVISHRGFAWMYDGAELSAVRVLMAGLVVLAVAWCVYLFSAVALIDPISCLYLAIAVTLFHAFRRVGMQRRTLKPSVVAKDINRSSEGGSAS